MLFFVCIAFILFYYASAEKPKRNYSRLQVIFIKRSELINGYIYFQFENQSREPAAVVAFKDFNSVFSVTVKPPSMPKSVHKLKTNFAPAGVPTLPVMRPSAVAAPPSHPPSRF